jgi:hypothetical protein
MVEPGVRDGWAETPPGPGLSAALGTLDLPPVPSSQVVELLRAQSRQSAHEQARLWATLLEVGLAVPTRAPTGRCGLARCRSGRSGRSPPR